MRSQEKISRKSSKSCSKWDMDLDRISTLPDTIIDQILSYLPIKDVVKTSLLSRKWRYKWATVPCLVFDEQSLPSFTNRRGIKMTRRFVSFIDHVLLRRSGPICKFELSYLCRGPPVTDIDKWILHVSRHPIKEFILKIPQCRNPQFYDLYEMTSCIFSCQNLTRLDLMGCKLKPPSTFMGFKNLKSLILRMVSVGQDVLENLISSCPMLEELTLVKLVHVDHLNINAPNLQSLEIEGVFVDVSLENTFCLAIFSVSIDNDLSLKNSVNLIRLLADMPLIRRLVIEHYSLELLAAYSDIPEALRVPCVNLRHMFLSIDLSSFDESSTVLCIFRSVPNLEELGIRCCWNKNHETRNFWQADHWNCLFTHLRQVKIDDFTGEQAEIDFINFMLLTSPILARMTLSFNKSVVDQWDNEKDFVMLDIAKQLLSLKRASPEAHIIFMDPCETNSDEET